MKAEELKCFKAVAAVIGEEAGKEELQKVLDVLWGVDFDDVEELNGAFLWDQSPQGHAFWWQINNPHHSLLTAFYNRR